MPRWLPGVQPIVSSLESYHFFWLSWIRDEKFITLSSTRDEGDFIDHAIDYKELPRSQ